jgi:hypothetical protein
MMSPPGYAGGPAGGGDGGGGGDDANDIHRMMKWAAERAKIDYTDFTADNYCAPPVPAQDNWTQEVQDKQFAAHGRSGQAMGNPWHKGRCGWYNRSLWGWNSETNNNEPPTEEIKSTGWASLRCVVL